MFSHIAGMQGKPCVPVIWKNMINHVRDNKIWRIQKHRCDECFEKFPEKFPVGRRIAHMYVDMAYARACRGHWLRPGRSHFEGTSENYTLCRFVPSRQSLGWCFNVMDRELSSAPRPISLSPCAYRHSIAIDFPLCCSDHSSFVRIEGVESVRGYIERTISKCMKERESSFSFPYTGWNGREKEELLTAVCGCRPPIAEQPHNF